MKKKDVRIAQLKEAIRDDPSLSLKDLAQRFSVSEMTVRRDLRAISGVQPGHTRTALSLLERGLPDTDYELYVEDTKQSAEKERIGRFAATLIEPNDILIIDTGSTTGRLAAHLPEDQNLTVLCYNLNILNDLSRKRDVRLILSGGYYHPSTQMFECAEGIRFIQSIRANKFFLAASGIHEKLGITCSSSYEVPTKQAMLGSSLTKILLADSSKFGCVRTSYFAQLSDIDIIVTDTGLSQEWRDMLQALKIKLYLV